MTYSKHKISSSHSIHSTSTALQQHQVNKSKEMSAMKELIFITLMFVASIQCVAIKNEQTHGEHGKGKSGSHLGFFVSSSHVMYI